MGKGGNTLYICSKSSAPEWVLRVPKSSCSWEQSEKAWKKIFSTLSSQKGQTMNTDGSKWQTKVPVAKTPCSSCQLSSWWAAYTGCVRLGRFVIVLLPLCCVEWVVRTHAWRTWIVHVYRVFLDRISMQIPPLLFFGPGEGQQPFSPVIYVWSKRQQWRWFVQRAAVREGLPCMKVVLPASNSICREGCLNFS